MKIPPAWKHTGCLKKVSLTILIICRLDFPSAMGSMSLKTKTKQDKAYVLENLARQHSTLVMILGLKMVSREALTNHNQKWVLWGHIFP